MVKLKQLTDNSWLVLEAASEEKVGILTQRDDETYLLMAGGARTPFKNRGELIELFGNDVFGDIITTGETGQSEYYVGGHLVPDEVSEVINDVSGLPLYRRNANGTIFAAGYYCIKYPKQPLMAFTPRYDTLIKYGFSGPFMNKYDARSELSRMRKGA